MNSPLKTNIQIFSYPSSIQKKIKIILLARKRRGKKLIETIKISKSFDTVAGNKSKFHRKLNGKFHPWKL